MINKKRIKAITTNQNLFILQIFDLKVKNKYNNATSRISFNNISNDIIKK